MKIIKFISNENDVYIEINKTPKNDYFFYVQSEEDFMTGLGLVLTKKDIIELILELNKLIQEVE